MYRSNTCSDRSNLVYTSNLRIENVPRTKLPQTYKFCFVEFADGQPHNNGQDALQWFGGTVTEYKDPVVVLGGLNTNNPVDVCIKLDAGL